MLENKYIPTPIILYNNNFRILYNTLIKQHHHTIIIQTSIEHAQQIE
jgi:hypothetical protein